MTWLARLKKSAIAPEPDPEKPTKPGFGGFGGTPAGLSQESGGDATAANDPAHAQDFDSGVPHTQADALVLTDDPDRHSWPHTTAMNSAEIDSLTARVHLFTRRGIGGTEAEGVADGLVIRDRDGDDRRLCLECQHLRGGTSRACNQWRAAGLGGAGVPADMVMLLQRCDGFKEMTR
jgi:hypothetical protein